MSLLAATVMVFPSMLGVVHAMEQMSEQLLTFDDWLDLPEDDFRLYELVDGRLVPRWGIEDGAVVTTPTFNHQVIVGRLHALVWIWVRATSLGAITHDFAVHVDGRNGLEPDLAWLSEAPAGRLTGQADLGVPALVIEVLSPSTARFDATTKRDLYARAGVREYWLVDADLGRVEIYRAPFHKPELLMEPDVITSGMLPGFELALADLFDPSAR